MLASPSEVYRLRNRWSTLNNTNVAQPDPNQTDYDTLIAALDAGWEVELPVLQRSVWNLTAQRSMAFHFVLTRSAGHVALVLSLPDGESVRRLITDHNWTIGVRRP
jgi:hypothetical protein